MDPASCISRDHEESRCWTVDLGADTSGGPDERIRIGLRLQAVRAIESMKTATRRDTATTTSRLVVNIARIMNRNPRLDARPR